MGGKALTITQAELDAGTERMMRSRCNVCRKEAMLHNAPDVIEGWYCSARCATKARLLDLEKDHLLRPEEAAAFLGVELKTIRNWISEQLIEVVRVPLGNTKGKKAAKRGSPRIRRSTVRRMIKSGTKPAVKE